VALSDWLTDRSKLLKLIWVAYLASLVFIGLGVYLILRDLMG
jgi:hypothetical protein